MCNMSKKSTTDFIAESHNIKAWVHHFWEANKTNTMRIDKSRQSYQVLPMFPYPSAYSLHIGHPVGYIGDDIHARFMRMNNRNVLHCFGFDAFGLPAEQYAIETGQHPEITTQKNIANMQNQIKELGFMIDWSREIVTSDPSYYKWTQWIFLKFYEHFFDPTEIWDDGFGNTIHGKAKHVSVLEEYLQTGKWSVNQLGIPVPVPSETKLTPDEISAAIDKARLAYLDSVPVNWCPDLGTVLANEEVIDGKSERGNFPVISKNQKQWVLRLTAYGERLSAGFDKLNWPESTVMMQKNWIGISKGMDIDFQTPKGVITIYTTRPDTILGVTFIAAGRSRYPHIDLQEGGAFTGEYATHPMTNARIPIWVADYVIDDYGTGYVMGVPAHDARDFAFAHKYGLEIVSVLAHQVSLPYTEHGDVITLQGIMQRDDFIATVPGRQKTTMRLRDWIFSRQRYWGEPFPVVHCPKTGKIYPIDESELPLILPDMTDFKPSMTQEITTPLQRCTQWMEVKVEIVNGKAKTRNIDSSKAQTMLRDANTMPNWAGSCWYYLRYIDPRNNDAIFSDAEYDYWCSEVGKYRYCTVDTYVGGSEHAVLHFLYARFWHMFLFDIGVVKNPEPFNNVIHQGLVSAPSYFNPKTGHYIAPGSAIEIDGKYYCDGDELEVHTGKMGKRYKNGIECGEITSKVGVGAFRLHLMYLGPLTESKHDFKEETIIGMVRFLRDIDDMADNLANDRVNASDLNKLIYEVTKIYEDKIKYNTAIAKLIEFLNNHHLAKEDMIIFLQLLAPMEPHLTEYLYQKLQPGSSIFDSQWPKYDQNILDAMPVNLLINVNGKFKSAVEISASLSDEEIIAIAGNRSAKWIIKRMEKQVMVNFL